MEGELRIVVKWSGKEYDILDIQEEDTVLTLKERIHRETGVRPERQKLLNLKFKGYILNGLLTSSVRIVIAILIIYLRVYCLERNYS